MSEPAVTTEAHPTLQGQVPSLATLQERIAAMDQAFDYRGDVTVETSDGRKVDGYIFDRRQAAGEPYIRMMVKDSDERVNIKYADIVRLAFTGRDTAAGKSWETWVKKYNEKKAAGEKASIESEPLE